MATVQTIYEVQTRFVVDSNRAVGGLQTLRRETKSVDRNLRGIARRFRFLFGGTALAAGVFGARKTFANLNLELEKGLGLAAQVNAQFSFSPDPIENFNTALSRTNSLMRDLVKDAARLPGEMADFITTSQLIGGGVFAGGGGLQDVRRMAGQLAFVPVGSQRERARQAQALLFGQAGIDRPLFATLHGSGFLPDAETFNRSAPSERLAMLDKALSKFADNPAFRGQFLRTFEVQWGTLMDNLFGPQGIGGQIAREPFNKFLTVLSDLNTSLDTNMPTIVSRIRSLIDEIGISFRSLKSLGDDPISRAGRGVGDIILAGFANKANRALGFATQEVPVFIGALGESLFSSNRYGSRVTSGAARDVFTIFQERMNAIEGPVHRRAIDAFNQSRDDELRALGLLPGADESPGRAVARNVTNQTFHIKLDLKSDRSMSAMAVRLRRAVVEATGDAPLTPRRNVLRDPGL